MAKSKLGKVNKKIEQGVVSNYKKIEDSVVGGFNKIADKFVDSFLAKEGESVEDAKARIAKEQTERKNTSIETTKKYSSQQNEIIEKNFQNTQSTVSEARKKSGLE